MSDPLPADGDPADLALADWLTAVPDQRPLVEAVTNDVTVDQVAQTVRNWGGLPVMSDDAREVDEMVAGASACLLNMGTVSETGEETMLEAGRAATDHGVPVVVDPVGVGATSTRDRVARRLLTDLDVAILTGNHGEIAALAGEEAEVRGVESVGEYADVAESAVACARETGAVVVASGERDVVATGETAYELTVGHPKMGAVVGTGCTLGGTLATFAGVGDDPVDAALAGTLAFGLAGEAAADERFGPVRGPASYEVAFGDAMAGLAAIDLPAPHDRIDRLATGVA
jgi:hydroxyethylthiazole kinase